MGSEDEDDDGTFVPLVVPSFDDGSQVEPAPNPLLGVEDEMDIDQSDFRPPMLVRFVDDDDIEPEGDSGAGNLGEFAEGDPGLAGQDGDVGGRPVGIEAGERSDNTEIPVSDQGNDWPNQVGFSYKHTWYHLQSMSFLWFRWTAVSVPLKAHHAGQRPTETHAGDATTPESIVPTTSRA